MLFMKRLNNIGIMLHPCFSPTSEGKISVKALGRRTINFIFSDMFFIKETKFVLTPYSENFLNNSSGHVLSYAFLKSTNQK